MAVYVASEVEGVRTLHPYIAEDAFRSLTIREQIAEQAKVVQAAHAAQDRRVRMHIMCWWPRARGRSLDDVMDAEFSRDDALLTLSREYGFDDWDEVSNLGNAVAPASFESALDDMLNGNIAHFRARLEGDPQLATARSAYGHRSTLLHYLGANGVESHRQVTPLNAVEMASMLIEHGAEVHAEAKMYGGGQTAYALATTSAHPHNAGIIDQLKTVLGS